MSSVLGLHGPFGPATSVVGSVGITLALGVAATDVVVDQHPDRSGYATGAVLLSVVAFTCFAGAVAMIRITRRLRPALWGYLPGLGAVLAIGLLVSEAQRSTSAGTLSPWWGLVVLASPTVWVPLYAVIRVHLESRRVDSRVRSWRGRI
ncbi:hypothetical protein CLV56_2399 [Mumia flava]|uniref:Uncharacterized protein n=1 Tax=Mumia flava TaxID=1348852 RepID=A0A0B2BVJ0_9ACTN|nr:hypothetical protein [Mumia flava]PJJ58154.1 hypothetical protein CLV56_2399 [Mumia flava]